MLIPLTFSSDLFNPVYLKYLNDKHRYQIFYGGAGSGKSVFVAQRELVKFFEGGHNFLIVRKTGKTNRNSTFALIKQILNSWNIPTKWYKINKSEMTITNTVNGSQIAFAGLDDVEKLKSVTFENGILTDVWIEEASEVTESDFNQLDLRLRGFASVPFTITMTFNPIDANFWAKARFFDRVDDNCSVCKTTYLDNRFIDDQYRQTLEKLKEIDAVYYNVYALGEWGVLGNKIFTNYVIEDFDISKFSDCAGGQDYGYNAPSAVVKVALKDEEVYVCNEVYQSGLTNQDLIILVNEEINDRAMHYIADCAEPDRIEEFTRAGYWIDGCEKGEGSIKAGLDWLKTKRIHIHKTNCPNTAREISTYKYREDKNGNVIDIPVTYNDHAMDALRYAVEDWRKRNNEPLTVETIKDYGYNYSGGFERNY